MVAQEICRCRQNNKHVHMNFFFLNPSLSLMTFFLLEYKGISGFPSSPPDQRSFFRWIQVVSSSAGYRVCNVRGLRMWHSDTERPVGTNRNVITSRGSIALCYSSPPLPPVSCLPPQCWLSRCVSARQLCQAPWLKPQTNLKGLEPISDTFWENTQKLCLGRLLLQIPDFN